MRIPWHASHGGGLLRQPLGTAATMHVAAADSKEATRLYLGVGYPF